MVFLRLSLVRADLISALIAAAADLRNQGGGVDDVDAVAVLLAPQWGSREVM